MMFSADAPANRAQIQFLPAGDGVEHVADQFQVGGRKFLQQRQAVLDLFQQQTLRRAKPAAWPSSPKFSGAVDLAQNPFAQLLQRVEPLLQRDDFRVGDGVGRAREQVGEADLRAHRAPAARAASDKTSARLP